MTDSDSLKSSDPDTRVRVREQMEFYFSDSNLTKDRFLKKEIENSSDGYINLSVFLNFNKIRSLTTDAKQIAKSLKHSEFLELNEEKTMVRRRTPFVEPTQKDIDKKTIYIEDIPIDSTNESIKSHFEQFGKVCYISLPKFKSSNELKGFAFVEFEEKSSAKKALAYYEGLNPGLVYDHTMIGKFPKFNAKVVTLKKRISNTNHEINQLEKELNPNETDKIDETKPPKTEKKQKELKMEIDEVQTDFNKFKVISKKAWSQLKDDYLNRQKQEIAELKSKYDEMSKQLDELRARKEKKSKPQPKDQERGCILRLSLDSNIDEHFKLLKMTRQQFKDAMLKDYLDLVAYVDVEKTCNRILIRFKTAESAQKLISDPGFMSGFQKSLLEGEQEDQYFEKINASRSKKLEKKEKKATRDKPDRKNANEDKNRHVAKKNKYKSSDDLVSKKPKIEPSAKHLKFVDD